MFTAELLFGLCDWLPYMQLQDLRLDAIMQAYRAGLGQQVPHTSIAGAAAAASVWDMPAT
jgi:hypothetical protein